MYIQYTMDPLCLPMDLEDDIPENHLVRVVNTAVNRLDDAIFDAAYPGGGRDSYHPKMLTKIIIYAYTQRIYSSRQIAKAVRENIPFMWLAGRQRPDFRTINRFRSQRMKDVLQTVFTTVLEFLADEKYISLDHYFIDGTKIEANANRYTFVWGKAVSKHKVKLQEQVHALFANIEAAEDQEEHECLGRDLPELGESSELSSEKLEQVTQKLEAQLLEKPKDKLLKKVVRKLRKDLLPRLLKYEQYQVLLGDRNSFSKTDPDAGYGSEENYAYLEKKEIQAVVKYGSYHKEKSKAWKENVGMIENWTYTETEDTWMCPAGQTLHFRKESKEIVESGYEIRKRHYRSESCEGCPLREVCTKAAGNREVVVSLEQLRYQKQAREILRSEEGPALTVRRMTEPESVFGQLKSNWGFRRFLLRGMEKVTPQVGWLSLAHNLLKQATNDQKRKAAIPQ
ncbi:transposase [Paenibacillus monticola]|uniref:Transposase n=1 Tax=Paenibacillus monticola TaxID=2666075 RepID=A0A7X2HAW3_9BACL|nr:transposase [Paenibacillus monticola]MRN56630.1 transposase [Paenibacillus monticola]